MHRSSLLRERQQVDACSLGGLYSLGLNCQHFYNITYVEEVISMVDQKFDLVLIVELWTESLMFLKQLLNFDLEDVVQPKLNFASEEKEELSRENEAFLRNALWPDYLLYNHFLRKMKLEISKHKEYLEQEIAKYEREMNFVSSTCEFGFKGRNTFNAVNPFLKEAKNKKLCQRFLPVTRHDVAKYMAKKYQMKEVKNS